MLTILIVIIAVIVIYLWMTYNKLQTTKTYVEEAKAQIDVQLKKRFDLVPNLVNTVKGYAKHESTTLENVVKARNAMASAQDLDERVKAGNQLHQTLGHLFALSESYPNLKADQSFLKLQEELTNLENKVGYARQSYNANARVLNQLTVTFPSSIVAKHFHIDKMPYLETPEEEKAVPKVEF